MLNFFACAACTFGDQTMMSFSFGLVVFVAIMVSEIAFLFIVVRLIYFQRQCLYVFFFFGVNALKHMLRTS